MGEVIFSLVCAEMAIGAQHNKVQIIRDILFFII